MQTTVFKKRFQVGGWWWLGGWVEVVVVAGGPGRGSGDPKLAGVHVQLGRLRCAGGWVGRRVGGSGGIRCGGERAGTKSWLE